MKVNKYISLSFIFGLAGVLASCTQDEIESGAANGESATGFSISVVDEGYQDIISTTRTVESGFSTKFEDGDAIGIFAVKSGEIVDGIDNHKFVYTDGEWENAGNNIEYLASEFNKMTFWAYYPYSDDVTFDASSDTPFASYISSWTIGADQSENYGQYDLMTSTGEVEGDRLKGKVYFTMHHAMALAVVELPAVTYAFTNDGVDAYQTGAAVGTFTLNGEEATPYYSSDLGDWGVYRFLVKPETDFTLSGTYTGVQEMEFTATGNLTGGVAKLYEIEGSGDTIEMELEVGDYLCADGSIAKASEAPANAVAVVYYIGNAQPSVSDPDGTDVAGYAYESQRDALLRDYPSCTHGLAIALTDANDGTSSQVGFKNLTYSNEWFNDDSVKSKWGDMFLVTYYGSGTNPADNLAGILGYNNTALMIAYVTQNAESINVTEEDGKTVYSGSTVTGSVTVDAYDIIMTYRANIENFPLGSAWYMPDLKEWRDYIMANGSTLDRSCTAVGGETISDKQYWTSNERNATFSWHSGNDISQNERGSGAQMYRLAIAF